MKKIFSLSIIILIILSLMQISICAALSVEDSIKNTVEQFLDARWKLLQDFDTSLSKYYDLTLQSALPEIAKDKNIVKQYFIDINNEYGITVHDVRVFAKFNDIKILENSAQVNVIVDAEVDAQIGEEKYTSYYAGIKHIISLVKKNDKWLITNHESQDMYTLAENEKQANGVNEVKSKDLKVKKTKTSTKNSSSDVGILWYLYYQRDGAAGYAATHWKSATDITHRNPNYKYYSGNNCANFVSQCFYEGGKAQMNSSGTYVWWYNNKGTTSTSDDTHSNSWSLAADQAYHLVRITDSSKHRGQYVSSASELNIGDSIYYDWTNNGVINHTVIVVKIRNGVPYVAGNTADEYDVPWNKNAGRTKFLKVTDYYWIN